MATREYNVMIVYPADFPNSSPRAYPLAENAIAEAPHRYPDGSLCLAYPFVSSPNLTAVDVAWGALAWLQSFERFIQTGAWGVRTPFFSALRVSIPYGYSLRGRNSTGETVNLYAQPCSALEGKPGFDLQDVQLTFDVTNPNALDIKIVAVFVNVLSFQHLTVLDIEPLASGGTTRRYSCHIKPVPGSYRAALTQQGIDFLKLSPGELEEIGLQIKTATPGAYRLGISLEYTLAEITQTVNVGTLGQDVAFFESRAIADSASFRQTSRKAADGAGGG